MVIEKQPFRKYNLEESKQDILNIWLNAEERQQLNNAKAILKQSKDSTAFKTLAAIGYAKLMDDKSIGVILAHYDAFQRRNARLGIPDNFGKIDIPNSQS